MRMGDTRRKTQDARLKTRSRKYQLAVWSLRSQVSNLKSSSGLSLIAVMWIVTILTVLASEFIYSMQLEIRIARNWSDQVSAFYAAKGGLESAIAILRDDETGYDSLDEDWAEEITGELNNSTYETLVIDESGRINVNTADEETLTKVIAYCIGSSDEKSEEEANAEAQTLASAIIEKRPYRTVAEMAKVDNMTPELLYGRSAVESTSEEEDEANEGEQSAALVDITTVYSADKNVTSDGGERANINSDDAGQIQERVNPEGEELITQQDAQVIVDYRDQQGGDQQGQGGQQGQDIQGGQPGGDGQSNQGGFEGIGQLLDVPAISQQTFDSIRDQITTEDEEGEEGEERRININAAGADELQNLDGIDSGIAESIVRYREQRQFGSVDEIREVKLVSMDEMKAIVDKVTISGDEVLQGKVNINTAPLEILQMLPGLDEEKAQAIVDRRAVEEGQTSTITTSQQGDQETGPFTSVGQLLDVNGIDEETFKSIVDHVAYRSCVFRIESEGRSSDRKIVQNCVTVVDRSGDRIKTKYWKQQ